MTEQATPADSAKVLKQTLRAAFPAVRFSVRLSRGTGYGNYHVSWTDGPTTRCVERITHTFQGEDFDGMQDLQYATPKVLPDGRESGIGLILCERRISTTFARRLAAQVAAFYGVAEPTITERVSGYWQIEGDTFVADTRDYWSTMIYRASHDRTLYAQGDGREQDTR